MKSIIHFIKNKRKQNYITTNYKGEYAFIGIGSHSIQNLYPVLSYLRINLKYICTKSTENAELINTNFKHTIGTNDLDRVLNDPDIKGVLICSLSTIHFKLISQALKANKNVFVEKPPCYTLDELDELIELEKNSKGTCFVGLQRRYAPINKLFEPDTTKNVTYNYRFVTGAYPEGDELLDLFIHPIDLLHHLFGKAELSSILTTGEKGKRTHFVLLKHPNNIIGSLELSSNYTWNNPSESLTINSKKNIFTITNNETVSTEKKMGSILGIPLEKVFNKPSVQLQQIRNGFSPILFNNQIYSQGYFDEIKTFIDHCEKKKSTNKSSLQSLVNTYQTIKNIKKNQDV